MKKYKLSFNLWGLVLFFIIMIPNFYWFAVPAPIDILRKDSVTVVLDTIASIAQVLIVITLCAIVNKNSRRIRFSPFLLVVIFSCLLYFITWNFYYKGITNAIVILALCILPCLAFLFFAIDRKNQIAMIPICIFTLCHLLYGVINFIL